MAVHVAWYNKERTVILQYFSNPWNWDDYYRSQEEIRRMLNESRQKVDIIIDFTNGSVMPSGAITHFRRTLSDPNPKRGLVMMVGMNPYLRAFEEVLSRFFPRSTASHRVVDTLEEALFMITEESSNAQPRAATI